MLVLLAGATALAGPVDLYGFGAIGGARCGGGMALPEGSQTVFLNPALLQDASAAQLVVGAGLQRGRMAAVPGVWWDTNRDGLIDTSDPPLQVDVDPDPADAVWVAVGRPIGGRFGFGFNAVLPVSRLLRIQTFEPSLPAYPFLGNAAQRFDMALGFGWEQLPGLSVGGAVQVIARSRFSLVTTLELGLRGAEEGEQELSALVTELSLDPHQLTVDIVPALAPMVALHWDVGRLVPRLDGLSLGAAWRASTGVPVDVDVDLQANLSLDELGELEPLGLSLLAPLRLRVYDHYLPEMWSLGIGWRRPERYALFADLRHTRLSRTQLSVAQVLDSEVDLQLLGQGALSLGDGNEVQVVLRDTTGFRLGGEVWLPRVVPAAEFGGLRGVVRLALGREPSALAAQGARMALLDADRLLLGGGIGVLHDDPFHLVAGPVRWEAHGQLQRLGEGELAVDTTPLRAGAPVDGGTLPIGGALWAAGLQWSIDY